MDSNCKTSSRIQFSLLLLLSFLLAHAQSAVFDIRRYGSKADGRSDIYPALSRAFKEACAAPGENKVFVPPGKYFLSPIALSGPCKGAVTLQFDGKAQAPSNPGYFKTDAWVVFKYIDRFTLTGSGSFDGQGNEAWTRNDCKKTKSCRSQPTNMRFDFLTNSKVNGITSINSKMFHMNILGCRNLALTKITIRAPEDSANTDGIHIGRSDGVTVTGADIKTGDDCISVGDGTKNFHVSGVRCGPGHGISIGSLGKFQKEEDVAGVWVRNCTLTNTMWGVRIKTWPSSPVGRASDMHFDDIIMNGVGTANGIGVPVLIDQIYCPWNQCKANDPSKVKLSKVSFRNIRGSSVTKNVVQLKCSAAYPCDQVELSNINLSYRGSDGSPVSTCQHVRPRISGKVPHGC